MKLVVLESPYTGKNLAEIDANIDYARACIRDSLKRDEAPIASHLLYTQEGILDDAVPEERKNGMEAGHVWYRVADLCVVYQDKGISEGMIKGIAAAERNGVEIQYRSLPKEKPNGEA